MDKSNIVEASVLGTIAFNNNKERVPSCDKDLMDLIGRTSEKMGDSLPLLNAWLSAWDNSNMLDSID